MISVQVGPEARQQSPQLFVQIPKIPRRELSHKQYLNDYVAANRPVVVQDATPGWKALQTWTPEFFKNNFGDQTVDVTYGVQQKLGDVIDGVIASTAQKPGPYLHKVIIHQHMPALLPDLSPENEYAFPMRYCSPLMPRRFRRPDGYLKLLIGGVGGKFPIMHYDSDNAHAVITEIFGDKEFVLFAPEDTDYVYPHPNSPSTSQIDDLDHVDLDRFPDFQKATQHRVVIGPGECIFVPSRWWHAARVVTTSISVCTNMMHSTNWRGFVDLACNWNAGKKSFGAAAKRAYFGVSGTIMSISEKLQDAFPGNGIVHSLGMLSSVNPSARR